MAHRQNLVSIPTDFGAPASSAVLPVPIERLTVTLAETTRLTGIPRSTLYRLLSQGRLRAVKAGRRTLLAWTDVTLYLSSLPPATFRAARGQVSLDRTRSKGGDQTGLIATRPAKGR